MPYPPPPPPRLLLASVLKPVDDTRMRKKFADTLLALPGYHLHVAGRGLGDDLPLGLTVARMHHHDIFWGHRLSLNRLAAHWRYWRLLQVLQPRLVVVHAPELLPLTLLWQRLGRGRQFVYDIRENYAGNVLTQGVYRGWAKRILAAGLRWVEGLAARRAAALTLAEASYAQELPYLATLPASRVLTLENKYQPAPDEAPPTAPRPLPAPTAPLRLLYSGTISELNGIREAVALTEALHRQRPGGAVLTVVGFCQRPGLLAELHGWVAAGRPVRLLLGNGGPVPHDAVVAEIQRSHLGLALYRPHPSTWRCRPTKLFEYLAHGLPVLVPENPLWQLLVQAYGAGLALDPAASADIQAATVLAALAAVAASGGFYPQGLPEDVLWASEGKKLRHLVESLLADPTFTRASA